MEIHSVRIEHGPVQTPTMSYSQRQPQNHRPNNHSQDIYNPSRSPLSTAARYPYPASPQLQQQQQQQPPIISQVQVSAQRYAPSAGGGAAPVYTGSYRDYARDSRPPRITLLQPDYATGRGREQSLQPGGGGGCNVVHIDGGVPQGQQPIKKIRLQEHRDNIQPLRIDTRFCQEQPGTYNPQTEAISPTLPGDNSQQEDQPFRSSKDELLQQIAKVDREIAKAESQISILKKKQQELEEIANKPTVKSEVEEDAQPKHQSLPQKIYAENRKKAQSAHCKLDSLGQKVEWPLYNQPSDTAVYHENKRKHVTFKKRLLEYLKRRHADKESRNAYLTETYSKLMQEWLRKVDKVESSAKRKAKEAKNREFFEKVFPELRKQREDKERWNFRFNRVGARVKSEADMEEIMDNLQEQAMEDKKMRSYAVIPPILLDARERSMTYQDDNGFVADMELVYKSRQFLNIWTASEKELFKEKYLQHPKNFGVIASFIERKSVADCVQYYYLSKKTENFKQLLRKSRQRTRSSRNNTQKVNSTANTSVVDIMTTGVTTRLQREQQQKTVVQQMRDPSSSSSSEAAGAAPPSSASSSSTSVPTTTVPPAPPSTSPSVTTTTITTTTTTASTSIMTSPLTTSTCSPSTTTTTSTTATAMTSSSSSSSSMVTMSATMATTTSMSSLTSSAAPPPTASVISSGGGGAPVMSTGASVVTSSAGGGGGGQPPSPKPADNATAASNAATTTTSSINNEKTFGDFNALEEFRGHHQGGGGIVGGGKFFGDDAAKGDGSVATVTAADGNQDGVAVIAVKMEPEPSGASAISGGDQNSSSSNPTTTITATNTTPNPTTVVFGSSSSAGAAVAENKKKKERRKDKENTVETSDDDAVEIQDKSNQGNCTVCNAQLGGQLQSRPLAPSQAAQYGLREDQVPPSNGRVCNTCRCKCVRSRHTHCPLPTCPNSRGRVKRLRSLPQRLHDLASDVRDPLLAELHVPSGCTKCCSACFNRIQRRLGPVEEWTEDEVVQLKNCLTDLGANWQVIGERLDKPPHQVRAFYAANRKRLNLETCLGDDRKPTLTDEEESGSSTSSCEESGGGGGGGAGVGMMRDRHSSDTTSAAESPPVLQALVQSQLCTKKEDYDSSATETADEAQTPDHYQGSATITPVTNDGQPRQNASPLSVKDLVLNVIEFSLMKNAGGQVQQQQVAPISGMAPTISSILNNDSNEVTIVREYTLNPQQQQQSVQQRNDLSFTKLMTPLIGATITPVPPQQPHQQQQPEIQQQNSRDDLVILSVQDGLRGEPETLDLSIKKPREPLGHPQASVLTGGSHGKHQSQSLQQQQQLRDPYLSAYHQERKSPAFPPSIRSQKLPSPKPANPKSGSITLGTPIINQTRYDGLLRQMTPETKMGSITQGTPIHMPPHMQDKRMYEYYGKQQQQRANNPNSAPPGGAYAQYRQPAYTVEQQLSRQVIMSDYITSQQMLSRRGGAPTVDNKGYYPGNSPHRTPPPQLSSSQQQQQVQVQQQANQQRQGVIQRHTRPQYLPPGHEALSSLVDVAVQQPSLPVPQQQQQQQQQQPHEGLGKTMADNIMEQPHRFQMMQQQLRQHQHHHQQQQQHQQQHQQQQQRIEEHRRAAYQQVQQMHPVHQRQQQQQRGDSSTLTAASLIDAIITHQINQTAEGGREVVTNAREPRGSDLLFQSFHRDPPPPPPSNDNNGERSPSVISIDLDGDQMMTKSMKELPEATHDFGQQQQQRSTIGNYGYHSIQDVEWKRRLQHQHHQQQQQVKDEGKQRSVTPQQQQQQQTDERQIIRYHVEPVSPPDNHWSGETFRRFQPQPQQNQHISALDYVKNRIVEVMRTEDDKKDDGGDKERSDSPGEMVIDEEKHDDFNNGGGQVAQQQPQQQQQQGFGYYGLKASTANDSLRNNEPKPLLSAQYEPLSDED